MSEFLDRVIVTAARTERGLVTGEPGAPHRQTWAALHRRAREMAAALIADGVRPGDAVAVLAAEPVLIAPVVQAAWLAGASVTMLHQPTARTDLQDWGDHTLRVLRLIGARTVLLGESFGIVAPMLAERTIAHRLISELTGAPAATLPAPVGEDDVALLQLTSGSTDDPKAVRITHRNLLANLTSIAGHGRLDPDDEVIVSWLPLFHDMGMVTFLALPMLLGIETVQVTPVDFVNNPLLWIDLLSRYRATITGAPNFAYAVTGRAMRRLTGGEGYDLSRLRAALNGAEPIDEDVARRFIAAAAPFGLRPESLVCSYGMAECTVAITARPLGGGLSVDVVQAGPMETGDRAEPANGTVAARPLVKLGPPLSGIEVKAVGVDGAPLGDRAIGRLWIRGDSVTPGYLTAQGPVGAQDADGWLDTGDLGYLVDGEVVICGRAKDVIILGGRNLYPTDIERVVTSVPGVRSGNAVAVRIDAGTGRESFAVVAESKLDDDADIQRLIQDITSRVVNVVGARPSRIAIVPPGSLPKTPSGKLRRSSAALLLG
ncbi:fatty acyl-AMP ligase [Mangrovihabitans endophyticus]|uniref:Fatty-acyl-CoA synthase n=1 Tax=Mangrovihabitans endophyticus TaxID=1751298 RepID=A0A8J3BW07_9ACTN|nr:fatty acyl-AMP ligase [Mangrovihabitans endophyticus]GGK74821.1 fatty-acyl-CoA synthase [Mangrovihabitans endophyticus]